jgi:hypothetical protein
LDNWDYCSDEDRRFYSEREEGLKPAGANIFFFFISSLGQSKITNSGIISSIPLNCYDTGVSYYDPSTGNLHDYSGVILRKASVEESEWIILNCRVQR